MRRTQFRSFARRRQLHPAVAAAGQSEQGLFIAFAFLDATSDIIIVGTTLEPLAHSAYMYLIQFAIIGLVEPAFRLVTPQYGMSLRVAYPVVNVRLWFALKDTMIMLIPVLLVLVALIFFPGIDLFLHKLFLPELVK